MENLSGGLAQDMKNASSHRRPETSKAWTLLLVGELGNIISLRVSKPLAVFVTLCFCTICTFAVVATLSFHGLRSENEALREDLDNVESQLAVANKAKEGAQVRLMLLEGQGEPAKTLKAEKKAPPDKKAKSRKKAEPRKTVSPAKIIVTEKKVQPAPKKAQPSPKKDEPSPERKSPFVVAEAAKPPVSTVEAAKPGVSEAVASASEAEPGTSESMENGEPEEGESFDPLSAESLLVEKLEIWKEVAQRSLKFQFSLKNVGTQGRKVKGYTFVVLKGGEGSKEPARGSPWTPLKDGLPTIFKRGQYFSIARFKYVRGTIPQIQDVERFKTATVYVFTEKGDLLIQKVFDVPDILRS